MEYLGYFSIDKNYLKNIDDFEYLLDKFFYSHQEHNAFKNMKSTNKKIRKRIYVKSSYYEELFEMAKQRAKVKGNIDLNKLVNSILALGRYEEVA